MRINSNRGVQELQRVIESGVRARRREEREECETGMTEWGREWKVYGFSWEVLRFDDFTYDFSWEVLKFTISTSHFMVCFEQLTKKVSILCRVLRATGAQYCKIQMIFWNFRQYGAKAYVLSFPEEGDARTDARTDGRRNNQLRAQPSGEMHEN